MAVEVFYLYSQKELAKILTKKELAFFLNREETTNILINNCFYLGYRKQKTKKGNVFFLVYSKNTKKDMPYFKDIIKKIKEIKKDEKSLPFLSISKDDQQARKFNKIFFKYEIKKGKYFFFSDNKKFLKEVASYE